MQDHLPHYSPSEIEKKWQETWKKEKVFEVETEKGQQKYYILEMFPYPSGTIHMGHVRNYTIGDVIARYKKAQGFHVLHPMGWDAFGLPAENAAIQRGIHPAEWTDSNIGYMKEQFQKMGWLFDWRREVKTCDPSYYKWEQLFFLNMLEKGLAYRKLSTVNWCPTCNTVLANEQVLVTERATSEKKGLCWRCDSEVVDKELIQWFFKISSYAEELLQGCDELTGWPEQVRTMQKNWIGKSQGTEIDFEIVDPPFQGQTIKIFTTRPDTLFGVTFVSLAVEHPFVKEYLEKNSPNAAAVRGFVERVRRMDKIARSDEATEKEGVPLGIHLKHPLTHEKIPLYLANFVLMDYGTGAVMAVPAHDKRDYAFAKKYNLKLRAVVEAEGKPHDYVKEAYTGEGKLIESGEFSGIENEKAKSEISSHLNEMKLGRRTVQYRLRDWGISRQRYWGAPIPIIHCEGCGVVPVPRKDLPVVLPHDVEFTGKGASPLASSKSFLNVPCPHCNKPAKRETDTMDTFVESSWYYLRFASHAEREHKPFLADDVQYWIPIDQYIGGVEHATMHLLYFRFFHRCLQDLGWMPPSVSREPVRNLLNQGIVYKDGAKMSKSKGNVIDPNALIQKFGADTTRLFILFAAPPDKVLEWNDAGVEGAYRFLGRVWRLIQQNKSLLQDMAVQTKAKKELSCEKAGKLKLKTHQTIQKVTQSLEKHFHFNVAIAAIMELVNEVYLLAAEELSPDLKSVLKESMGAIVQLLAPFAPHLAEELWSEIGDGKMLITKKWLLWESDAIETTQVTMVVQVNGKLRAQLELDKDIAQEEAIAMALSDARLKAHLEGKKILKTVFVPQRLINFVVQG